MAAMVFVLAVSAGACDDSMDRPVAAQEPEATTGNGPGGETGAGTGTGTGDGTGAGTGTGTGGNGAAGQQTGVATFTPLEVANILLVLNQAEVEQAQLAVTNATNGEVKAYAQLMATEHSDAVTRLNALVQRLGGAGAGADPTSTLLQREGRLITQDLATQTGAAFDLAYMTAQVSAHSKVLGMIDVSLVPSAGPSPEMAIELRTLRVSVLDHDVRALQVQNAVRRPPTPG